MIHLVSVFVGARYTLCPPYAALSYNSCQAMPPVPPAFALLVDPKMLAEFALILLLMLTPPFPFLHVPMLLPVACAVAVTIFLALPRCSTTERTLHQDQKGTSHETGGQTSGIFIHMRKNKFREGYQRFLSSETSIGVFTVSWALG